MAMKLKVSQVKENLIMVLKAGLVALIHGSPGIGKSDLVRQIAAQFGLLVIDFRLAQCDPTDLLGFPDIDRQKGKARYTPMETFPLEGEPLPQGYNGWLLFLDEITSASKAVQAAAYKLILDRMVGMHRLHKNVVIIGAGNFETDGAIVEEMSTALQSRMIHMELVVDNKEWLEWAAENDLDWRITSFINFKPDLLYSFRPDHTDRTYSCPRTWAFVDRLIKKGGLDLMDAESARALLAGCLGEGVAREFILFCKIQHTLPQMIDIKKNPLGIRVPEEPSTLYALTGAIASHMDKSCVEPLMEFTWRMPVEFQVVTMRDLLRRKKELLPEPPVQKWVQAMGERLK